MSEAIEKLRDRCREATPPWRQVTRGQSVPDIGDFADVPVIEVLVAPGRHGRRAEDPLVTLESDKATMDVPAPSAASSTSCKVSVGDKVSEGVADR